MENINNIFLIGMMGSWKSSIGKKLSKKLNIELCDTDNDIVSLTNLSIDEIFDLYGEDRFREMEAAYFKEKSKNGKAIFSTGGGIILRKASRQILISSGLTIFLDADINVLAERIKNISERPLLSNGNKKKILNKLYKQRIDYYKQCADLTINTENSSPEVISEKIIRRYNEKN